MAAMSEESVVMTLPAPDAAPQPTAVAPRRTARGTGALLLLALLALTLAAFALWRVYALERARDGGVDPQALATRVEILTHTIEQLRGNADTLRTRMDDTAKVDQSEREELLGLGERARLLEDAVANLADKRLSGHDALSLDEAELLLNLGSERYRLFHDPAAALAAYRAADSILAQVEDAAFSTVRQSVSAEIEAFAALQAADTTPLSAKLVQLREQIAQLPVLQHLDSTGPAPDSSRLWRVLGAFVQVHHGAEAQSEVARRDAGLARELAGLDLRQAEAALLARDDARYHAALASARTQLGAFDPSAEQVHAAQATLAALDQAKLAPPPPALLGTALKELRNLRATHALRLTPATKSTPPQTPAEAAK
jgi:uroporphyrin-3 C-methyltransferase